MTRTQQRRPIPAFLSIDVEPDGFQVTRSDSEAWDGYAAMFDFCGQLRENLILRSGSAPKFGWYFRTDPQIAEVYGRPDHVLAEYPRRMAHLVANGDYFGVHAHPIRWCAPRRTWIHDFGDPAWHARATRFALEAYACWSGSPARRFRAGAGFLTNEIVAVLEQCGVRVDLTLEPVAGWGLTASDVPTSVDTSPIVGAYTDCSTAPLFPFRPSHHDFRVPGGRWGRDLVMVPLSTSTTYPRGPLWRRLARRLLRGSDGAQPKVQVLYPSGAWPSERFFWDLVDRGLRSMQRPYLSLAIRTDARELRESARVSRLFQALLDHPLAAVLSFVDPLEVAPNLISGR